MLLSMSTAELVARSFQSKPPYCFNLFDSKVTFLTKLNLGNFRLNKNKTRASDVTQPEVDTEKDNFEVKTTKQT